MNVRDGRGGDSPLRILWFSVCFLALWHVSPGALSSNDIMETAWAIGRPCHGSGVAGYSARDIGMVRRITWKIMC